MGFDVDITRVSRSNESLRFKLGNGELLVKGVDCFKYLGRDGYCTKEINMIIAMTKNHLTEKYHS